MCTRLFILGLTFMLHGLASAQDSQLLIPHVSSALRQQMANPVTGFLVFDTDSKSYWYYQGDTWYNLNTNMSSSAAPPPSGDHVRIEIASKEKMRVDSIHLSVMFPDSSTVIGYDAGASNAVLTNPGTDDQGKFNTFLGLKAGFTNNPNPTQCSSYNFNDVYEGGCGCHNTFVGHVSGYENLYGRNNTFLGSHAGFFNKGNSSTFSPGAGGPGSENTFMGFFSGYRNQNGFWNTFIGSYAGENNGFGTASSTVGRFNTYIGAATGRFNALGFENVYVGTETGGHFDNTGGNRNVLLGYRAGFEATGDDNVIIGQNAGKSIWPNSPDRNVIVGAQAGQNITGNDNVFIGYRAGQLLSNTNSTLIIGNSAANQLIYGEFNTGLFRVNGRMEAINTAEASLTGNGALTLGVLGGSNLAFDPNEIQARFDSAATTLQLQTAGGQLTVGSITDPVSDKLLVEAGAGLSPFRARVAGNTKFRVHGNGGVSVGVNATPPTDGALIQGNIEFNGTQFVANTNFNLNTAGTTNISSGSNISHVTGGNFSVDANGTITLESTQALNLVVGSHIIQLHPTNGIIITSASDLTIDSAGDLSLHADGNMTLDATTITLNGSNGNAQRAARVNTLVANPACGSGCVGVVNISGTSASVLIGN